MGEYLQLGPSELVDDRPFTAPERSAADLTALRRMADRLGTILSAPSGVPDEPRPLILQLREADGHAHRVVISQREGLLTSGEIHVVGFFGQKRPGADAAPLDAVDHELIGEFSQHPGILSYSSLELGHGQWGNMVLLRDPDAREHWRTSAKHAYAVRELAPPYYLSIRLHNGMLTRGLQPGTTLKLLRTKYYAFQGGAPWLAVRELQ
jgi:hypothetical protein